MHVFRRNWLQRVQPSPFLKYCQLIAGDAVDWHNCVQGRDLEAAKPGSVVFLDFEMGTSIDEPVVVSIQHVPDRAFWNTIYEVALDDLSGSGCTGESVVNCEGEPKYRNFGKSYSHEARCYESICDTAIPETQFIPGG